MGDVRLRRRMPKPPAALSRFIDPDKLVSWVNQVCWLDDDAVPVERLYLVLAASSGEHKVKSEGYTDCGYASSLPTSASCQTNWQGSQNLVTDLRS